MDGRGVVDPLQHLLLLQLLLQQLLADELLLLQLLLHEVLLLLLQLLQREFSGPVPS